MWCQNILVVMAVLAAIDADPDPHGGVPMGVPSYVCDNANTRLDIDWDPAKKDEHESDFKCLNLTYIKPKVESAEESCPPQSSPHAYHICYPTPLTYNDRIPVSGYHRPLWAKYGEYEYIPVQRWLHNLEHGAVAFLYHPCANPAHVEQLRNVTRNCLWKHIITPYDLPEETPLALVTWGCKLTMPVPDIDRAISFIRTHAMHGRENSVISDGQYGHLLTVPAKIVSTEDDSEICPARNFPQTVQRNRNVHHHDHKPKHHGQKHKKHRKSHRQNGSHQRIKLLESKITELKRLFRKYVKPHMKH